MKKITTKLLSILSCCVLAVSANAQTATTAPAPTNSAAYNYFYTQAVLNSAYTAPSKISHNLVVIGPENHTLPDTMINGEQYYLMVSLKSQAKYYPANAPTAQPYNTDKWNLWVTASPELKNKVKNVDSNHINMRLKQILGLPPAGDYNYIITFWVRPQDMFRPCPDNEITDNTCDLGFPTTVTPAYRGWVDSQRVSRFFGSDTASRYSWTQLGYTYDWDPKNRSHQGCSEFVVKTYANIYMRHAYTVNEYLYHSK